MIFLMLFFYLSAEITHFSIPRSCDQLTSIDLSKNELTSLPESLALLANLQKLNASDNKLTQLPLKYVINVHCNKNLFIHSLKKGLKTKDNNLI